MPASLLKGAKKVPKGTLFFIGQNGQLYMRTGPYLEGDGKFMFGTELIFISLHRRDAASPVQVDVTRVVRMISERCDPVAR